MRKLSLSILALSLMIGFSACNNTETANNEGANSTETSAQQETSNEATSSNVATPPADAKVFFVNLEEGQKVSSPVHVVMGVSGMEIHPAGEIIEGTGHHHILIDQGDSYPMGEVIPADESHVHFGKGQTEADLELTPGKHTLTMQFADGAHTSYGKQMAATVTIEVE